MRYERYVLPRQFAKHVRGLDRSNLVIDIGANVGLVSETVAKSGARVISFEPNPDAFQKLKSLAKRYSNIDVRSDAAGKKNQPIKLFWHKNFEETGEDLTQASSLLSSKPNVSNDKYVIVNEIDFAEFLKSLNEPIELLKMDIEGYEVELLNHLLDKNMIGKIAMFYVETHEQKFPELIVPTKKLKERIKAEGYQEKFFFEWH